MKLEERMVKEFTAKAKQMELKINCLGGGNVHGELAVIASYPGDHEARIGIPLSGKSGQDLWRTLHHNGITRNQPYVTNVIKRIVLTAGIDIEEKKTIPAAENTMWEELLDWELDQLPNLKYILCMGGPALKALTGERGIKSWRGSVKKVKVGHLQREVMVIFTFNPAMISYQKQWEPIYRFDVAKVKRVMEGKFTYYNIKAEYDMSHERVVTRLQKLALAKKPIGYDIETLGNETVCVGLANDEHEGFSINFRRRDQDKNTIHTYTVDEEIDIRLSLQYLFNRDDLQFIAQHGTFDAGWMYYKDRIVSKAWFDTLLAHHTLYPTWPHNLAFLVSQYTDHPYYKDEKDKWKEGGDIAQYWEYNVKDAVLLLPCQRAMSRELEAAGLTNFFYDHVMRLQPHLVRMMVLGVSVDVEWKGKIADELGIELTGKLFEFHKAVQKCGADWDEPPNPNSPKQIKKLLFDDLELKGHGKSTDKANRQRIIMHPETSEDARRMLQLMDEYKVDKKFHSTYALSRIDEDDRMRSEYKQFGTKEAPGRLSSSGNLWGTGANMQNQPERAYPMFCADEGYELTYFDLSQAEARIVAYGWNVMALKENFIRSMEDKSYDVHRANAERIFHVAYEDTPTKDRDSTGKPTIRFLAKRCVHGLNYRMGPGRLSEVCGIPYTQAEEAYRAYHFAFREIRQAWRHMITDIRKTGVTWSYMGRRLLVLEHMDNEALDSIVAFKPQSTIGDKVSGVIYLCHDDPAWPEDARIILNIHDALVAMNRPEDREIVMKVMKHHAEAPININGEDVVIPAEFKHSTPDDLGIHRWSALEG